MDDAVAAMLQTLNDGFPPVERMTAIEARAAVAARRQPVLQPRRRRDDPRRTHRRTWPGRSRSGSTNRTDHDGARPSSSSTAADSSCATSRVTTGSVESLPRNTVSRRRLGRLPAGPGTPGARRRRGRLRGLSTGWSSTRSASASTRRASPSRATVPAATSPPSQPDVPQARYPDARGPGAALSGDRPVVRDRELPHPRHRLLQHPRGHAVVLAAVPRWRRPSASRRRFVAPARADSLAGLPPAIVVTAELDPLHSEGVAYAAMLRAAGVPVVHRDFPGLFHGFLTMMPFAPAVAARELLWATSRALAARTARHE